MSGVDPVAQVLRTRHAELLPDPMFEMAPTGRKAAPEPRPDVIAAATCPVCKKRIGLVVAGERGRERAFREHDRQTYGGYRWPCKGSGVLHP